ncbi:MAG: F-type H+-transporting ATPase subunit delta [Solirubrobacteraceae bacterium]|jgi:ATP synthase F1 delta subunit|nr:F-type H+-transporting ATPase subunit delta [Solirubrobacteraceae bacterium]
MEEIAQVYARALFEVALEHDVLDEIRDELAEFADAMHENRDMAVFFFSPYFSVDEKKEGLDKAVVDADSSLVNFLQALIERHRMPAIFRIRTEFETLWAKERRMLPVRVTSAIELDNTLLDDLGKRIGEQVDRQIELSSDVDPDILGGIVLRVGNVVLDASIKNRLEQLRKQVAQG